MFVNKRYTADSWVKSILFTIELKHKKTTDKIG